MKREVSSVSFTEATSSAVTTFTAVQKHVKQKMEVESQNLQTAVKTLNGKFHPLLRGNVPTNFIIDLQLVAASFA